jgi:L-amino acid N-acyltransferase YncA
MKAETTREYPQVRTIGGAEVTLRLMVGEDKPAVLAFARSLPEHDLLFLRRDITEDAALDDWVREIRDGLMTTVLAIAKDSVVGYASIERNRLRWAAHVAELRVMISENMRGKGLGHALTQEAFAIALAGGIEKMVAQMTLDQKGAIATFEGIGFRPEALLRDHVKDRQGNKHDLLVLSHEVAKFESQMAAYGINEAFGN